MKDIRYLVVLALIAMVFTTTSAGPSYAVDCPAKPDPSPDGVCPIKILNLLPIDRCTTGDIFNPKPTPIGNMVCDSLQDSNKLRRTLGTSAGKSVADAQRDMNDFVKVVTKDAINPDAVIKFNQAKGEVNKIFGEISGLVKDPTCGVNGTLKHTQAFFASLGKDLVDAGSIAVKVGDAAVATTPAIPQIASALTELNALAGDIQKVGQTADAERKKLEDALKGLQKDFDAVSKLDLTGAIGSGAKLVTSVGPFTANCGACVTAMGAAIGEAATAIGSAAATPAACPTTGGTECIVGIPVSTLSGAGSALTGVVGSAPCVSAATDIDRMGEYVNNISDFVNTSVKIVENLQKNVKDLQTATDALTKLAQQLPSQLKPRLDKIAGSIDAAGDAVNAGLAIMANQVAPRVDHLTTAIVQQLGSNATDMYICWNKMNDAAAHSGKDAVDGVGLLIEASTSLVDGGQIVSNLQKEGQAAVNAAGEAAGSKWKDVDSSYGKLHKDLWGVAVGTNDMGKTAQHLAGLIGNQAQIKKIADDLGGLSDKLGKLLQASIDAGKNAFLDRDRLKTQSRQKFDIAQTRSQNALVALAKANGKKLSFKPVPGKLTVNISIIPKSVSTLQVKKIGTSLKLKP